MRLDLERTGGFAGRTVRWSLDLDALDPDGRTEVHELLAQAGDWAADGATRGAHADGFSYRLVSEPADEAGLDVRFVEPLPDSARRLLDVVRSGQPGPAP